MKILLSSGIIRSRFVALLTLGLSAVVVGVDLPAASANSPYDVYSDSAHNLLEGDVIGSVELIQILLKNGSKSIVEAKLYAYQQAHHALVDRVRAQNEAFATYTELVELTEDEVISAFPSGNYKFALDSAGRVYNVLQERAEAALATSERTLLDLNDGEQLSDVEMAELHVVLGL